MLTRAKREGWEGLIAKDGRSVYQSGKRTPAWRKLKLLKQQEFVVGGWTDPKLTRQHFGALLLGYFEGKTLHFAGSVGTGFDEHELERVSRALRANARTTSPFAGPIPVAGRPHWITPALVVEVRFTEWTTEGLLRQPVYLGTREDKRPADVRKEVPAVKIKPAASSPPSAARTRATKGPRVSRSPEAVTPVIEALAALEASKRDGDVAAAQRRHAPRDESGQALLARPGDHQGRAAALLRVGLAVAVCPRWPIARW